MRCCSSMPSRKSVGFCFTRGSSAVIVSRTSPHKPRSSRARRPSARREDRPGRFEALSAGRSRKGNRCRAAEGRRTRAWLYRRRPAQQPAHPHGVWVVVLDPLLAAEAIADRALSLSARARPRRGRRHSRCRKRVPPSAPRSQGRPGVQVGVRGAYLRSCRHESVGRGRGRRRGRDIARQDDHGNATFADRVLHGGCRTRGI